MPDFLSAPPFLTMSAYILMLTAGFTFLVEWDNRRRWKKERDEHEKYAGHESYRGGSDD